MRYRIITVTMLCGLLVGGRAFNPYREIAELLMASRKQMVGVDYSWRIWDASGHCSTRTKISWHKLIA